MVTWRAMRTLFLLPVLMLGFMAVGLYAKNGNLLGSSFSLPFLPTARPVPTRQPAVEGATSIVLPEVNPVLHISTPPVSIFAPASAEASAGKPAPVSSFDAFRPDYEEYFRLVEQARQ